MNISQTFQSYQLLFKIEILHDYYLNWGTTEFEYLNSDEHNQILSSYNIHQDLAITPTEVCRQLLQEKGMILREVPLGFEVFIQTAPTLDKELVYPKVPVSQQPFTLTFTIRLKNINFLNFTDLPFEDDVDSTYYFSNSNRNQLSKEQYVTQEDKVKLATNFLSPIMREQNLSGQNIELWIYDETKHYRNKVSEIQFELSPSLDIKSLLSGLSPGIYSYKLLGPALPRQDGQFYYNPDLFEDRFFGIIAIRHAPEHDSDFRLFNPDGSLTPMRSYRLRFKNRTTFWRYIFKNRFYLGNYDDLGDMEWEWGDIYISKDSHPLTNKSESLNLITYQLPPPNQDHGIVFEEEKVYSEIYVVAEEASDKESPIKVSLWQGSENQNEILPFKIEDVPSCVPAFIGFTEKAQGTLGEILFFQPVRIESIEAFERIFGGPNLEGKVTLEVLENTHSESGTPETSVNIWPHFKLYYALKLYFANGGQFCYVVSAGSFSESANMPMAFSDGLDALKTVDDVTLICMPEAWDQGFYDGIENYGKAIHQCEELGDRFVIVDLYDKNPFYQSDYAVQVYQFRSNFNMEYPLEFGIAYGPDLKSTIPFHYDPDSFHAEVFLKSASGGEFRILDPNEEKDRKFYQSLMNRPNKFLVLPPSSAIAGIFAKSDRQRGPSNPPANYFLNEVIATTRPLSEEEIRMMILDPESGKSINAIKYFASEGAVVWGARTLAGNNPRFRYIHVSRLIALTRKSIAKSIAKVIFEIKTPFHWEILRHEIDQYLSQKWKAKMLTGSKKEEAYYIKIGLGETMNFQDLQEGRLILEIGLAVLSPKVFHNFRIITDLVN